MKQIVYVSTAVNKMEEADLVKILDVSRKRNTENQITGLLLYSDGIFIQLIEGAAQDIDQIYASIEKDDRHENVIKLVDRYATHRTFPDWSMGFTNLPAKNGLELVGYINPTEVVFGNDHNPEVTSVLKTYLETNNLLSTIR
jgi:hypothetical protein